MIQIYYLHLTEIGLTGRILLRVWEIGHLKCRMADFIKWADLENVVKHHRLTFSDSDFVKPVLSIEDAVKELLG